MFDSHAHIGDTAFDIDRDDVIKYLFDNGVSGWVEVGTSIEESKRAIVIAEKDDRIYASVGVHPDGIHELQENDWEIMQQLANHPKVCAIGEVGFDTFREGTIAEQEPMLRTFIDLAIEVKKPVIFHVRSSTSGVHGKTPDVSAIDAHAELIRVLQSYDQSLRPKGVIHTFSGTLAQAQRYIQFGMMISFSGVLTFKKSDELREIAKTIPLESILVETDCPYLTPEPHRGERNTPANVKFVIEKIAELRDMDAGEVTQITHNNAKKLFNI